MFKKKHIGTAALQIWMEDLFIKDENLLFITGLPSHGSDRWRIREKSVRLPIELARNTMPGPDGIPAAAYKQLPVAVDIFLAVAKSMGTQNGAAEVVEAYSGRCATDCLDLPPRCYVACRKKPLARTRNIVNGRQHSPTCFGQH